MMFNSLQNAFTHIIIFNLCEMGGLFSVLLAAQCSGKSSETRQT